MSDRVGRAGGVGRAVEKIVAADRWRRRGFLGVLCAVVLSIALGPLLAHAALVKVEVVCADEREAGLRRVLNLGHTFGHAFEEVTHYRRFLHGEAVAWGLLAAMRLAERIEVLGPHDAARIRSLVRRVGPLPTIRDLAPGRILGLLPRDKKAVGGRVHWILPERVGKMLIEANVPPAHVRAALLDTQRAGQHA